MVPRKKVPVKRAVPGAEDEEYEFCGDGDRENSVSDDTFELDAMCAGFVDDEGHPDVEAYQAYEAEFGGEEGPTVKIRRKKIGNAAAIMHKMRVMYGLEEDADGDAYQAYEAECEDDEPESARKRQPRKAHPAPSVAMLKEAEKLAAQAEKAYEKVKRQKAKEALKNELNMAEHKRSPRKAHPAPSVAMLKEAEKLSNQAFKLSEKAKKQEAKELVAAATADAKETAAYATQVEKELGKAVRAAEKAATKLGDHTLGDYCLDDVRMLRATQLARSMVEKMVPPQTAEQWQEKFDAVCKACGELLDVTPAVARMAYIDPAAFDAWKVHEKRFNTWVTVTTGEGVLQDFVQAVAWYRKAANQGDADAQFNLGESYRNGQGVSQDYAQAAAWYRKAAEQGDPSAQVNLGVLYEKGLGVKKSYVRAAAWYRKAAKQGEPTAQSNLGNAYESGRGVPQDYTQAAAWYRKAAEQGDVNAQFNLGWLYDQGHGVRKNHAQAAAWYRKAADQGHADAQFNLGELYRKGQGVPKDYAQAAAWYRKAAEQGDAQAQSNLALVEREAEDAKKPRYVAGPQRSLA